MTIIVNLSSVFKLKPIHPPLRSKKHVPNMLSIFAELCNQHAERSPLCCSRSLFGMSNYIWVCMQYRSFKNLIEEYRLGRKSTDQFLAALGKIFSFLNAKVKDPKKLLAATWNQMIEWDKDSSANLAQLLEHAKHGERVYLISNTNRLHIARILELFAEHQPGLPWKLDEAQKETPDPKPIEIAPNVFLCLSYRYGLFKEGTPGLIAEVAKPLKDVTLVSQYPQDLVRGHSLGLKTLSADRYYHTKMEPQVAAKLK